MEFIKLEQFKSLDENIQKVLLSWWKPKRYDLYIDASDLSQVECLDYIKDNDEGVIYHSMRDNMSIIQDMIPLFTEGQLRQIIQNKFSGDVKVELEWSNDGYIINVVSEINDEKVYESYFNAETEPIIAYWYVVLEIAREEV